jgi:hypothetical protein
MFNFPKRGPILVLLLVVGIILISVCGTVSAEPVMKLNLSRLVILDDPNNGQAGSGFVTPPRNWGTDYWNGEATTVKGYVLIVNESGGISGVQVTFTVKKPDGSTATTINAVTNSSGIASFSYNLNAKNYYGNWTVEASATVNGQNLVDSRTFMYNWWGCANCHGKETVTKHGTYSEKSPYTMGYDFHRNPLKGDHRNPMQNGFCTACHQGYDKIPYDPNAYNDKNYIKNTAKTQYSADIHNGIKKCQDCHVNANDGAKRAEIAGCYDTTGCHAQKNTKLTEILTTTGYSVGGNYRTIYSLDTSTSQPSKAHTPSQTIPCLNCHGPGHDIWKPVVSGTSNTYTEDSQCLTCHVNQGKHSPDNPVYCTSCHSQDAHVIGILDKTAGTQPTYTTLGSANAVTKDDCTSCHTSGSISNFFNALTTYDSAAYTNNYQPQTDSFGYSVAMHNGTVNCTVCHDNTDFHAITFLNHTAQYTTNKSQAVGCEDCHVQGTNDSVKTFIQGLGLNPPQVNAKHNNSVPCDVCHSPSPHGGARFLGSDLSTYTTNKALAVKCMDCHANSGASGKQYTTRTGTYTMYPPYIGSYAFQHGNATWEGQNWGNYWTKADDNAACLYCHGNGNNVEEIHSQSALGRISYIADGATDLSGQWCANCHVSSAINPSYNGSAYSPATPPLNDVNNTGMNSNFAGNKWLDHSSFVSSDYTDSSCYGCHANTTETPNNNLTLFVHNVEEGVPGGPDCVSCHDIGGTAPRHVDVSTMKQGIHATLNSGATNNTTLTDPVDKACWACHGDGTEPDQHPVNYKSPKQCEDCHTGTTQFNALLVAEHYYSGQDLVVNATCQDCHSKSEMLNTNSDPDAGSTNATISHYGKPRSDLVLNINGDTVTDCYYCHQNATTVFASVMQNTNHTYMYNHSDSSNSPRCWSCHSVGRIHDQNHVKPQISNSLCLGCHQSGIGNIGPIPTAHNGTMNCYSCHMDKNDTAYNSVTAQIHGIKFIDSDGTYTRWDKTNAANCVDCHINQNTTSALTTWNSGYVPTQIPSLTHSDDPFAGKKWGNYWDNTSAVTACYYCHQNGIHKNKNGLLGNVTLVKGSNSYNQSITNGTWCANCHYTNANEYNGTALSPVPPRIDVDEGTATDGTAWFNHTDVISGSYTDDMCKSCHGGLAQSATLIRDFVHAVGEGSGSGCIACHESYSGNLGFNNSSFGAHANVNTTGGLGNLTDNDCKTCHYDTSNMFNSGWTVSTYGCENCHQGSWPSSVDSTPPSIGTTFLHGSNDCYSCHLADKQQPYTQGGYHVNFSTPFGAVKEPGWQGWTAGVSTQCFDCHFTHSKADEPFNAPGISRYMATKYSGCGGSNCHGSGTIHNTDAPLYYTPPTVSVTLNRTAVMAGDAIGVYAVGNGNAGQIYNASYQIIDVNGNIVLSNPLSPDDGEFGGVASGLPGPGMENFTFTLNTSVLTPGDYTLKVIVEKDTGVSGYDTATFRVGSEGSITANLDMEAWSAGNTTLVNWALYGSATLEQSTNAYTGNYSAKLIVTDGTTSYLKSMNISVESSKEYRVMVWINGSVTYSALSVEQYNSSTSTKLQETHKIVLTGNTSGWVSIGTDLTTFANADNITVKLWVIGNGTVYFDAVSVVPKPYGKSDVVNGGFEDDWTWSTGTKYFIREERLHTLYEMVKGWEPKDMTASEMELNTTKAVGTRSAGINGSGYWSSPYKDPTYHKQAASYAKKFGLDYSEGTNVTIEFKVYSDRMNDFAGLGLVFWDTSTSGPSEATYKVGIIDTTTDWATAVVSVPMPIGKNFLQLKLLSQTDNHVLFDEVKAYESI